MFILSLRREVIYESLSVLAEDPTILPHAAQTATDSQ
jgi:hypothetical protein